jgi:hypothetical protein
MEEAEYCHRLALMNRGRLIALDTPARLRAACASRCWRCAPATAPGRRRGAAGTPGLEAAMFGRACTSPSPTRRPRAAHPAAAPPQALEAMASSGSSRQLEDVFVSQVRAAGGAPIDLAGWCGPRRRPHRRAGADGVKREAARRARFPGRGFSLVRAGHRAQGGHPAAARQPQPDPGLPAAGAAAGALRLRHQLGRDDIRTAVSTRTARREPRDSSTPSGLGLLHGGRSPTRRAGEIGPLLDRGRVRSSCW